MSDSVEFALPRPDVVPVGSLQTANLRAMNTRIEALEKALRTGLSVLGTGESSGHPDLTRVYESFPSRRIDDPVT